MDKNDKGEESEEEIWEGPDESPKPSPAPKMNVAKKRESPKRAEEAVPEPPVKKDESDYGGSTDVDEPDTDDEIEMYSTSPTFCVIYFLKIFNF